MATRFTDNIQSDVKGDFVVRQWKWPLMQLFLLFIIVFISVCVVANIAKLYGTYILLFVTILLILCAIWLGWQTVLYSSRNRDLVMTTEFQNAMLAAATQLSTRFCFITKQDGTIVYIDPGFQALFPLFMQSSGHTVDSLMASAGITEDVQKNIISILQKGRNDRLLLTLKDASDQPINLMMSIDVLPRPAGYFLFRGRDYVERKEPTPHDNITATSTALLLAQALYGLDEGVLITNHEGVITYVNRALEHWLGYAESEMLTSPLRLAQITAQYGNNKASMAVWDNYSGALTLTAKDRSTLTFDVRQSLIQHEGQVLGIALSVHKPDSSK